MTEKTQYLNVTEAAELMGITEHDMVFLLETHTVAASVTDGKWRVTRQTLEGLKILLDSVKQRDVK